jgi:NitT/TauT family transport system substrate-binding protein
MAKTLQEHKSEMGKAEIVQGAYGSLLAMLKAGKADVAMELEPVASTAVSQGAHIVFSYPEMYGPFMLTGLYVLESYRDQHRAQVQGAVNALELAMRYAHQNPAGAVDIGKKKFPDVDPSVIKAAVDRMVNDATLPAHVSMDDQGWHNTVNVRAELGDLKDKAAADQTLDRSFSQNALKLQ